MSSSLTRPTTDDAAPYYFTYIDQVPDQDVLALLESNLTSTETLLAQFRGDHEHCRYAPGKWTVREVVGHLLDTERLFGARALHMARGCTGELPSMDPDAWVANAGAADRPLTDLLGELDLVRRGHLMMFRSFDTDAWERVGVASGLCFRVRAFPFIMTGHEIHHRRILAERYLPTLAAGSPTPG